MTRPRLLQLSGAVIDLVYQVEALPKPGEEARVLASRLAPGGGFNAMLAARRAGMAVAYAAPHGSGPFADLLRQSLAQESIEALLPATALDDQGLCTVLIDASGERTFITRDGAERAFDKEALLGLEAGPQDWWLLSGYGLAMPLSQEALAAWLDSCPPATRLVFDPSPVIAEIPETLLSRAVARSHWISANRREALAITGESDPQAAVRALQALTADGGALLRCGEAGCWLATSAREPLHLPAFPVDAIDTNGAGDTHVGSFIAALSAGHPPADAAVFANAAAALSTTRHGPATAPLASETRALMAKAELNQGTPLLQT